MAVATEGEETLALYMEEFSNADLDGDGEADFADTNGDGFPDQVPEGFPGDLDLRPGDGRFGREIDDDGGDDGDGD